MRRRLAGVTFEIPLSLLTKRGAVVSTVLDAAVARLEGRDFSGLEEVAMISLLVGASWKITAVVWVAVVGPLQGGSSSSSSGTGGFGRLEWWGALEALVEESEESTIQKQTTRRGVDKEEEGTLEQSLSTYISPPRS